MHTPTRSSFYIPSRYIFVTVRSTSTVKKGAQFNDEKVCTLFSHCCSLLLSCEKEEKRKRSIEKSSKKKIKKTNALPHAGCCSTHAHQQHHQKTRTEERRESERARERESDGRTEEVLSFFSRAGTSHPSRFFKTRFRGGRWKTKRHLRFVSVFDYNTQSARDVHIHR